MNSIQSKKIELTTSDKVIEFAIWFVLASLWALAIWYYSDLPETIPSHFNISDQVDGFAKKEFIFILPSVISILVIGVKILGKFPSLSRYGKNITAENYINNLKLGTRISRTIILGIGIIFFFITYKIIQNGLGKAIGIGHWFIPSIIFIIIVPSTLFIYKTIKQKPT